MPASWIDIDVDGSSMEGYLARPEEEGSHPAVVVIQEIWGVNSHIQSVADRLPAQGYVGLAPAMFHRQGRMIAGLHEELPAAIGWMQQCTDAGIVAGRSRRSGLPQGATVRERQNRHRRVLLRRAGVVPGGGQRIRPFGVGRVLRRQHHGVPGRRRLALRPVGKHLLPHPGPIRGRGRQPDADDVAKIDGELARLGKAHEFHNYGGAGHGFHCEVRGSYRPEAAQDAWGKAIAWFDANLKG